MSARTATPILATARLASDRSGIELADRDRSPAALAQLLAAAGRTSSPRRVGGRLQLTYKDAARLLQRADAGIEWDASARRAVENRIRVEAAAPSVLREFRRLAAGGTSAALAATAPGLTRPAREHLDDHQLLNVAIMTISDGWGACIFDEQGTGKTATVIATFDLLVERGEADVLLVVAPKSMVAEWEQEFRRFTGDLYRVAVADGSRGEKARSIEDGADVVVVNYETAVSLLDNLRLLAKRCRVMLAVDESFNVKNPDALRSGAVADLREWCTRAYVLCGTPAPNAAADVVAQFDLVDLGLTFGETRLANDAAAARRQIREAMEERGVYTRNLKRRVLPDLPIRRFTEVRVELAPKQRAAYQSALDDLILDLRRSDQAEFRRHITTYFARRSALLRICSNPAPIVPGYDEIPAKLSALDGILSDLVERRREKVIVWSFYRASLDELARRYERYGLARIDGGVTQIAERRDAIRRFQDDDQTMVFLGNPAAAGAGLTLHRSRVAVYESFSNQAAHFLQSLDRIHRRGQGRDVEYVALLCTDTIEEIEYHRLLQKADAQADLLGDPPDERPTREMFLEELLRARRLLDG